MSIATLHENIQIFHAVCGALLKDSQILPNSVPENVKSKCTTCMTTRHRDPIQSVKDQSEPEIQEPTKPPGSFPIRPLTDPWIYGRKMRRRRLIPRWHEREGVGAYVETCGKRRNERQKIFLPVQNSADVAAVGEGEESWTVPRFHGAGRPMVEVAFLGDHCQVILPCLRHHRHDSLDSVMTFQAFARGPRFSVDQEAAES